MNCRLWKISISSVFPSGNHIKNTYWAYNFDLPRAKAAALRWISEENRNGSVDTIVAIDEIK